MSRRARPELLEAGLGPAGIPSLVTIGALSIGRAVGWILIAQSIAASIGALFAGSTDLVAPLALGAAGAVLRALSTWAINVTASRAAALAKRTLRGRLTERMLDGHDSAESAVLATTGLDDLDDYYRSVIPSTVSAVVVPVLLAAWMLAADPLSALILLITLPLVPVFMVLIGMHTRQRVDEATGALGRLADKLVELARGLPVLIGLGRVSEQTASLARIQDEHRARTTATLRVAFLSALALELIATLSVAVIAVELGIRLLSGSVSLDAALLALLLAPECFGALRDVGSAFHSSRDGLSALRRVREVLATARGFRPAAAPTARLDAATVRYAGRSRDAVSNLSVTLTPGRIVALSGASGCGKSTAVALLTGTLDADAEVTGRARAVAPERLAYAAQAPTWFAATVRAELLLYARDGDSGAVDAALAEFELVAVADRAPVELSPGELRRLAVARALLRVAAGATLLVLDEPTAHLDEANAERVRRAIRGLPPSVAVLLVSHDDATLALADERVALWSVPAHDEPSPDVDVEDAAAMAVGLARTRPAPTVAPLSAGGSRRRWVLAIGLGVLATGLSLSLTAVSGWLIVRAAAQPDIMYLLVAIVGVRFFGLGRAVARYAERLVVHATVLADTDALRLRVWRGIASHGAAARSVLDRGAALDLLVSSIDELRDRVPRVVPPMIGGAISLGAVLLTVGALDASALPIWAGALAAAIVGALVVDNLVAAPASRRVARVRSELVRRIAGLGEAGAQLRANGVGKRALQSTRDVELNLAAAERGVARYGGLADAWVTAVLALLAVAVPVLQAGAVAAGRLPTETVAVASLLALACIEPVIAMLSGVRGWPALRDVQGRFAPMLESSPYSERLGRSITRLESLSIDDLQLRWPGARLPVATSISARVERGEWLVVDGRSGSGKTTLLTALMGALQADRGAVRADGADIGGISTSEWRTRVAWCPQDAHIFGSSIRANLLLGRPRTDPVGAAEMTAVLRRVGLASLIASLPDGLDTRVGVGGRSLSGGERQRLAVARALLSDADVLLLDEPTAHLDAETANDMMSDIRAATRDRIVVLVSHRLDDRRVDDAVVTLRAAADVPVGIPTLVGAARKPWLKVPPLIQACSTGVENPRPKVLSRNALGR